MSHALERLKNGALVVRDSETDEVMHPGVGPLVEARELYVGQSRLAERLPACVFDVGLGAGSNAVAARLPGVTIVSFERDLGALRAALTEPAAFGLEGAAGEAARQLLERDHDERDGVRWLLRRGELLDCLAAERERADVIFWDPFSPKANPTLWTVAAFALARRCAGPRCTLFTYSASTACRVALLLAGWAVGVGDATGSKHQTTAAAVDPRDLARPLDASWLHRLTLPSTPLPADAPPGWLELVRAAPQFQVSSR